MNKKEKNLIYADLMDKLKKSIKNEFYYESIFIEYAILEDRTESLLKHAKLKITKSDRTNLSLAEKLKVINNSVRFKKPYISRNLSYELLESVRNWKNKRNVLIHDLIKCSYNNTQIKNIALDGYEIVKRMNNKSTLVNRFMDTL